MLFMEVIGLEVPAAAFHLFPMALAFRVDDESTVLRLEYEIGHEGFLRA